MIDTVFTYIEQPDRFFSDNERLKELFRGAAEKAVLEVNRTHGANSVAVRQIDFRANWAIIKLQSLWREAKDCFTQALKRHVAADSQSRHEEIFANNPENTERKLWPQQGLVRLCMN